MTTAPTATQTTQHARGFVSLRVRLIIGATILLTILLAGLGYWFIDFAVGQAYERIERGLNDTLVGAQAGEDGDMLEQLGKMVPAYDPDVDVHSDEYQKLIAPVKASALYKKQMDWLATLHRIEPRGYGYTFVRGPLENQVIFIGDVWSLDPDPTNRERATQYGEYYIADYRPEVLMDALKQITPFTIIDQSEIDPLSFSFAHLGDLLIYTDDWGTWVSSYAPVKNSAGEVVGGIGIDFEAAYVQQVRDSIINTMGLAFILIYVAVIVLVVIFAGAFTAPILSLTRTAEMIGKGSYNQDLRRTGNKIGTGKLTGKVVAQAEEAPKDEVGTLAVVFDEMAGRVRQREAELTHLAAGLEDMVKQRTAQLEKQNEELIIARRLAEEATQVKSQFLATVSHELRTPLNSIMGFSQLLLMGAAGELNDMQSDRIDRIFKSGQDLLSMINDLLDLSKIEAGRTEIIRQPFAVRDWARTIVSRLESLAQNKDLAFTSEVDATLPDTLVGDAERLRQIAVNLIGNAIKFTDKGRVSLQIKRYDKDNWAIIVKDTGIGIPSHALETIFEEFRQVDGSTERSYGGSGLGLTIVRKLAVMMGGTVRVQSKVGEGSTFTVLMPLAAEPTVLQKEAAANP